MAYGRGTVVKGPDLFADYDHRPYVCLSDDTHPFGDEEALYRFLNVWWFTLDQSSAQVFVSSPNPSIPMVTSSPSPRWTGGSR